MVPYWAFYGTPPSTIFSCIRNNFTTNMDKELRTSREHEGSQHRMKQHTCKPWFVKRDMVCLLLQPSTNMSCYSVSDKIVSKFYGPFKILERIGSVAYGLKLPPDSKMDCYTVMWQLGPESWPAGSFFLCI